MRIVALSRAAVYVRQTVYEFILLWYINDRMGENFESRFY